MLSEEEALCRAWETEAGVAGRLAAIGATMGAGVDRGRDGPKLGVGVGVRSVAGTLQHWWLRQSFPGCSPRSR